MPEESLLESAKNHIVNLSSKSWREEGTDEWQLFSRAKANLKRDPKTLLEIFHALGYRPREAGEIAQGLASTLHKKMVLAGKGVPPLEKFQKEIVGAIKIQFARELAQIEMEERARGKQGF